MDGAVTYADLTFQTSSGVEEEVTYATLHLPASSGAQRGTRAEATAGKLSRWVYSTLLLGVLCLLLLILSIVLAFLLLESMESTTQHEAQIEDFEQSPASEACSVAQDTLNQTKASLRNAEETLKKWATNAGRHWYCPEDWVLMDENCYYKSKVRGTWAQGMTYCIARGGYLVVPTTGTEPFISETSEPLWIGGLVRGNELFWYNTTEFIYLERVQNTLVARIGFLCAVINIKDPQPLMTMNCGARLLWICEKAAIVVQLDEDPQPPAISSLGVKYTRRNGAAGGS
ncbi:NKG2-A/NKG2-B type II integral membrane protein-like [Pleurodeles waltl]|uniref:NKG2-A/NKG2-B type II integral membrane protein-like n=1 Tax=Pleurodeles waltl TaxID=8319 RepID=UPI0037097012